MLLWAQKEQIWVSNVQSQIARITAATVIIAALIRSKSAHTNVTPHRSSVQTAYLLRWSKNCERKPGWLNSPAFVLFDEILGKCWLNRVCRLRRQIFRQADAAPGLHENDAGILDVFQVVFVQDDEIDASKRAAKALAVNCAVLP